MWNDTDTPLAYLITFGCYRGWIHGYKRGSVDRFHNRYGSACLPPDLSRQRQIEALLKSEPFLMNARARRAVEAAIQETCTIRRWTRYASNVRTNHVHVLVSIGCLPPGQALNALKANATRMLRRENCWTYTHSPWSPKEVIPLESAKRCAGN